MKRKINKEKETDSQELFFETLRDLGLKLIVYIALAIVVFVIGKFFWWAGVVLFVIFTVYLLSELLINGFVLIVAVFTAMVYAATYLKPKSPAKLAKLKNGFLHIFLTNLLLSIFCLFLLILGGSLFVFFFHQFLL